MAVCRHDTSLEAIVPAPKGGSHREAMRRVHFDLTKYLEPVEVANYLYEEDVLSDRQYETLRAISVRWDKAEQLIDIIMRTSPKGYEQFIAALELTDQDHIISLLQTEVVPMESRIPPVREDPGVHFEARQNKVNLNLEQSRSTTTKLRKFPRSHEHTDCKLDTLVEPVIEEDVAEGVQVFHKRIYLEELIPQPSAMSKFRKQLVIGPPMSGKTHLALWVKNLTDIPYKAFLYYDLKTLNNISEKLSYRQLLEHYHHSRKDIDLLRGEPRSVLLFLDGLDDLDGLDTLTTHEANVYDWEAALTPPKIIYNIIKGNYHRLDADIIVTSAKYYSCLFGAGWKIYHLRGFNEESIKEFIGGSISNIKKAKDIASFLNLNPEVAEICKVPQVCTSIVRKLADEGFETGTLTTLLFSLQNYIEHSSKEITNPTVHGEDSVLSRHDESLNKLSALAADVCLHHDCDPDVTTAIKEEHRIGASEFATGLFHEKWNILPKPRPTYAFANKMFMTLLAAIHFANRRWRSRDLHSLSSISFINKNLTLLQFIFGLLTTEDGHEVMKQINPHLTGIKLKNRAKELVKCCVQAFRSCCQCGIDKTCCFGCKKPNKEQNDTNLKLFLVYLVRESQMPYLVSDWLLHKKTLEFCYTVNGRSCGVSLTHTDCKEIARYMKQAKKKIKRIRLMLNGLDGESAKELSHGINGLHNLQVLDLRHNDIDSSGIKCIAEALQYNRSLERLLLWDNSIGTSGLKALLSSLARNDTLEELDVSFNNINEHGASRLSDYISGHPNLRTLRIVGNIIGTNGMEVLREALMESTKLTLGCDHKQIPVAERAEWLRKGMKHRLSITNDSNVGVRCRGKTTESCSDSEDNNFPDQPSSLALRFHSWWNRWILLNLQDDAV